MEENNIDKDFGLPEDKFKPINTDIESTGGSSGQKKLYRLILAFSSVAIVFVFGLSLLYIKNKKFQKNKISEEEIEQEDSSSLFEEEKKTESESDTDTDTNLEAEPVESNESSPTTEEEDNTSFQETEPVENNEEVEIAAIETPQEDEVKDQIITEQKEGKIINLNTPENAYFIILSSSIDSDLAGDYAKKLIHKGRDIYLIKTKKDNIYYYKIAVMKSFERKDAENELEKLKKEFSNDIWILKY